MSEVKNIKRVNPSAQYKARVKKVLGLLPKNWREIIYSNYPEYNTAKGAVLINNVAAQRTADVTLTEILEAIHNGTLTLKP